MVRCSGAPSNPVSTTGRVIVPFSSTGSLTVKQKYQIRFFACFNYRMTGTERQVGGRPAADKDKELYRCCRKL